MKYHFIVIVVCITSMTYAMHKPTGNGNGHNGGDKKKQEHVFNQDMLFKMLGAMDERLKSVETNSVVKELQAFNKETLKPELDLLLSNLQVNNVTKASKSEIDEIDHSSDNKVLWITAGFLIGSLPWLIGRVILSKSA